MAISRTFAILSRTMQRIGIDVRLTYYRQGGIAGYMRQLVGALKPAPYDVLTLHNFRAAETLPFKRINCYTPCHHRFEALALGVELLSHRLDLLHSPDFIPPRFGAKHYVITVHDLAFLLFATLQTADSLRYYAGQIRRAVRQADQIIAVSQATKSDLMHLLDVPESKISVIWEGVAGSFKLLDAAEVAATLTPYRLLDDYLLFVGTIEPRKNLPGLLQAYSMLRGRYKDLPKLVMVGHKGWLSEDTFQTVKDLRLQKDVIWLEGVPDGVLPALYNGARVHLMPSLYEGFGFPPLEAMACGTPTVISDRGALREIGGNAALYVDPMEPESIAHGIETLLHDTTLYQTMRERGLKHVRQFNWGTAAAKTLDVYKKVLA